MRTLIVCVALFIGLAQGMMEYHHDSNLDASTHASEVVMQAQANMKNVMFTDHPEIDVASFRTMDLSPSCNASAHALGAAYNGCYALKVVASQLFNKSNTVDQAKVKEFCEADCKVAFHDKVRAFVDACTPLEIFAIEAATASKPENERFQFFKLLFGLKMPCIQHNNEYCLPTFITLTKQFDEKSKPTANDLAAVCKPCLRVFLMEIAKYMAPKDLKALAYIDVLCTRDGNTWCAVEQQEIDALPVTTQEQNITKFRRICSTVCTQKILIKIALAFKLFDPTPDEKIKIVTFLKLVDGLCSKAKNGETCGELSQTVGARLAIAGTKGCNLETNSCPADCKTEVSGFVEDFDCCIERYVQVEEAGDNKGIWTKIINFGEQTCGVPVPPACRGAAKAIFTRLVIRNIKFAVWYKLEKAKQQAIIALIILDIARELGVRENAVVQDGEPAATETQMIGPNGNVIFATDPNSVTVSLKITDDNDVALNSANTQLSSQISDGSLAFSALNNPNGAAGITTNIRQDPSDGYSVDPARSTTTTSDQTSSATAQGVTIAVSLSAAAVAAISLA